MQSNGIFKLSAVTLGLGLVNSVWAADFTCSNANGCAYSSGFNRNTLYDFNNGVVVPVSDNETIHVTVPAGNYQNTARTDNGSSQSGGQVISSSRDLFAVKWINGSSLTLKSGVTATLKEDYASSELVAVSNGVATLEKGVKLIIEDNYSQIHNEPDGNGFTDGNQAIDVSHTTLNTQADIELNNNGSTAIYSSGGNSTIYSSNHTITMRGEGGVAYDLSDNDVLHIDNVAITGNANQSILDLGEHGNLIINANNLSAQLGNNSEFLLNSEATNSTINLTNSNINVAQGISHISYDIADTSQTVDLNLHNTIFHTSKSLVTVNDKDFPLDSEDEAEILKNQNIPFTFNIAADRNSSITGSVIENPTRPSNVTVNMALTDSQWRFNQSNAINNLNGNNAVVTFEPSNEYKTLTLKGNLTGSTTFNLNTNIAENQGDKIIVQGTAEGNHQLGVTNQGADVDNHKLTLVETNGGNANFRLTNANGRVDLGAFQYFLAKEGNNWVLATSKNAINPTPVAPTQPVEQPTVVDTPSTSTPTMPVAPVETPVQPSISTPVLPAVVTPEPQTNPTPAVVVNPSSNNPSSALPDTPLLSDKANAQISLRQAQLLLVEDEIGTIHQRLGEIKDGERSNVWVKNVNARQKMTASNTGYGDTSGFKQDIHRIQLGADVATTDHFRIGGFVGRSQANVHFNHDLGKGKVTSNSVGLYATYLADNGIYLDNIAKFSRLKAYSDHTETRHYNAYTLASELGKAFTLADNWTITPKVQLAWTHLQAKENEDSLSSVSSKMGVRIAKGFMLTSGWQLQPYAEINAITSRNRHNDVHYASAALSVESSRERVESVVGLNAGLANHRLGVEVSRADGKRLDKPYTVQAVYRYQW